MKAFDIVILITVLGLGFISGYVYLQNEVNNEEMNSTNEYETVIERVYVCDTGEEVTSKEECNNEIICQEVVINLAEGRFSIECQDATGIYIGGIRCDGKKEVEGVSYECVNNLCQERINWEEICDLDETCKTPTNNYAKCLTDEVWYSSFWGD